jgi:hypothetical protein
MSSSFLTLLMLMASTLAPAVAPSFTGFIRLPVELYAADGTHLQKGEYTIQVKQESGHYSLIFLQNDQPKATIKGETVSADADSVPVDLPLIGTQFLRSSADPLGSEAERHWSKSGLPHYQEEKRDWKATLRAYTTEDQKEAVWVFEEKQAAGKWSHVRFRLSLNPK